MEIQQKKNRKKRWTQNVSKTFIENVENKNVAALSDPTYAIRVESLCKNFVVKNFRLTNSNSDLYAFLATNVTDTEIVADMDEYQLKNKQEKVLLKNFNQLTVDSARLNVKHEAGEK